MPRAPASTKLIRPSLSEMGRQLLCVAALCTAMSGCADEPVSPQTLTDCAPGAIGVDRVIEITPLSPPLADQLGDHEVVLTFDDGPERRRTQKVLEALAEECVQATFFLQGDNAARFPEQTRAILLSGHEVGSHGWAHLGLVEMELEDARQNIQRSLDALDDALGETGHTITLFRFPYLASTPELEALVTELELTSVPATVDGADWDGSNSKTIVATVMQNLALNENRGVILLHDPFRNSGRTVAHLIDELKANGFRIVAVRGAAQQSEEAVHAVR